MKIWNKSIKTLKKITIGKTKIPSFIFDFIPSFAYFAKQLPFLPFASQGAVASQNSFLPFASQGAGKRQGAVLLLAKQKKQKRQEAKKAKVKQNETLKILEKTQILKDNFFSNPAFGKSIRARYTLQKQSAAYSSPIRVVCKLFIVYIFGSFCWLASNTNKYSGIDFAKQKNTEFNQKSPINLFKEVLDFCCLPLTSLTHLASSASSSSFALQEAKETKDAKETEKAEEAKATKELQSKRELQSKKEATSKTNKANLPLLKSNSEPYTAETVENIIVKENENSIFSKSVINDIFVNGTAINLKLSPLCQEAYTQNYVGKVRPLIAPVRLADKQLFGAFGNNCFLQSKRQSKISKNVKGSKKEVEAVLRSNCFAKQARQKHNTTFNPFLNSKKKKKQAKKARLNLHTKNFSEIAFFARKPLFLGLQSKRVQPRSFFLNKDQILLQNQYNYSGTSLVSGPETDFIPRKLESVYNQFFCKAILAKQKSSAKNSLITKNTKTNSAKTRYRDIPRLAPTEHLMWVEDLNQILPASFLPCLAIAFCEATARQKAVASQNCFASQLPFASCEAKVAVASQKRQEAHNDLPKNINLFASKTFQKIEDLAIVGKTPQNQLEEQSSENIKKDTGRNVILEEAGFKEETGISYNIDYTDFFYEPRLESGFNYPDVSFIKNNKTGCEAAASIILQVLPFASFASCLAVASQKAKEVKEAKKTKAVLLCEASNCFARQKKQEKKEKHRKELQNKQKNQLKTFQVQNKLRVNHLCYFVPTASTSEALLPFAACKAKEKELLRKKGKLTDLVSFSYDVNQGLAPYAGKLAIAPEAEKNQEHKQKEPFLEFVYQPKHLQGYISYKTPRGRIGFRKNSIVKMQLNLRTPTQFIALDKTADLTTANCLLEKPTSSLTHRLFYFLQSRGTSSCSAFVSCLALRSKQLPFAFCSAIASQSSFAPQVAKPQGKKKAKEAKALQEEIQQAETGHKGSNNKKNKNCRETNLIKDLFSQNKNDLRRIVDAPESFFGGDLLQLGERFTIEKVQGNQKLGILYNTHTGNPYAPVQTLASPYTSTGTSLRTVFGKIKAQKQGVNFNKHLNTNKSITQYRTVANWSVDPPSEAKNKKQKEENKTTLEKIISSTRQTKDQEPLISFFRRLFYFNRVEGETDSNLESPFLFYDPEPKAANMSEETLFRIEEYEKSMLFPQVHSFHRGTAFNSLPAKWEQCKDYTNQNIEAQSILGGMRQRIEAVSTPETEPNTENNKAGELAKELQSKKELRSKKELQSKKETNKANETSDSSDASESSDSNKINEINEAKEKSEGVLLRKKQNKSEINQEDEESEELDIELRSTTMQLIPLPDSQSIDFVAKHKQARKAHSGSILTKRKKLKSTNCYPIRTFFTVSPQQSLPQFSLGPTDLAEYNYIGQADTYSGGRLSSELASKIKGNLYTKGLYLERITGLPYYSWTCLSKLVFFAYGWYFYKIFATTLNKSTGLLPVGFSDAIGLQTVQEKFRIIRQSKTKQSFRDLAGAEKTLSELRDLIWTFRLGTGEYSRKQLHIPYLGSQAGQQRNYLTSLNRTRNRFLLVGPPGTGKTLLVKALAAEANVPVIVQPASQLRMISEVENPVSALFHLARQIKPCILFLDELDTLGSAIDKVTSGATSEQAKALRLARKYTYTLLLELDGLTSSTNDLLVIGATNRPETLNPALTRAGRFDTVINCNLPSQEQRLAILSLYLNKHNILPLKTQSAFKGLSPKLQSNYLLSTLSQKKSNTSISKTINNSLFCLAVASQKATAPCLLPAPQGNCEAKQLLRKKGKKQNLRQYLAQKCYGLSHASLATVVNESALEAMLDRGKPVHTLETLERAVESVRTLTAKLTNSSSFKSQNTLTSQKGAFLLASLASQNSGLALRLPAPQGKRQLQSKKKAKKSNTGTSAAQHKKLAEENKGSFTKKAQGLALFATESKQVKSNTSIVSCFETKSLITTQQFLVFTAYETAGSLLFTQKLPIISLKDKKNKNLYLPLSFKANHNKGDNLRNIRPLDRTHFEINLLQVYAGKAAASIYSSARPQTSKLSATPGLYTNPSNVGTNVLNITALTGLFLQSKNLTLRSIKAKSIIREETTERKTFLWKEDHQMSRFVSEISIPKQQTFLPWKASIGGALFASSGLQNNKVGSFALQEAKGSKAQQTFSGPNDNSALIPQSTGLGFGSIYDTQQGPLASTVKLSNPLTTRWFRVYLYRSFFRYDSPESIENKEYYPINDYLLLSNKGRLPYFRNVSTRRLVKQGVVYKDNRHIYATVQEKPVNEQNFLVTKQGQHKGKEFDQKEFAPISEESIYLAIVASSFHKASTLIQEQRELLDYCVHKTLRHGVLYEFSLKDICDKF